MLQQRKKNTYTAVIAGVGRIGYTLGFDRKREQPASHTSACEANGRIRFAAACDTDPERLAAWGKKHPGAHLYRDADLMAAGEQPDIAVVAVNEDAHVPVFLSVLNCRPRLVILEKPVALSVADGALIKAAADRFGVPVLVNHERRFAADYRLAKQWLSEIGDIQTVSAALWSGLKVYSEKEEKTGLYSLLHDGTHLVDTVCYLLDVCLENPSVDGVFRDQDGCVRNLQVSFGTPVCQSVTFQFSGRSRYFGFDIDIHGTEGRIRIGNGYAELSVRKESRLYSGFYSLSPVRTVPPRFKTGYFSNMVQNAVDFLDTGTPLCSTLQNGLETLAVLEEIKNKL